MGMLMGHKLTNLEQTSLRAEDGDVPVISGTTTSRHAAVLSLTASEPGHSCMLSLIVVMYDVCREAILTRQNLVEYFLTIRDINQGALCCRTSEMSGECSSRSVHAQSSVSSSFMQLLVKGR